jgi:hypothetical protein
MISGSVRYSNSSGSNLSYINDYDSATTSNAIVRRSVPSRTLDDVRQQVAQEVAWRVITSAEMVDGKLAAQ